MLDVLAIGAHPDDVEAGGAGFLIKAKKRGLKTGLIILTRGEAGGFAKVETRIEEAKKASSIMGVDYFKIMEYKDAGLEDTAENAKPLAQLIRELKPKVILAPWEEDYHPDHIAAHHLVNRAAFVAGRNIDGRGVWEPQQILYFSINFKNIKTPDIIIDITEEMEVKRQTLMAHASQFGPILQGIEMLGQYYGMLGGISFGEGFVKKNPVRLKDIGDLIK